MGYRKRRKNRAIRRWARVNFAWNFFKIESRLLCACVCMLVGVSAWVRKIEREREREEGSPLLIISHPFHLIALEWVCPGNFSRAAALFQSETLLTELPHNVEAIYRMSKKGLNRLSVTPFFVFSFITFNRFMAVHLYGIDYLFSS